jgi:hypothetical protein
MTIKKGVIIMSNKNLNKNELFVPEFQILHREAVEISKSLHRQEFLMIEILQKIDAKKIYRLLGYKSLFQYSTIALKLSSGRAYNFIQVARKAAGLSRFQEALRKGAISLSKAKRISSVVNNENEEHWLKLSKNLSQRSLERAVAKFNPRSSVQEGTHFVSESVLEFRAAILEDTEKMIKRAQDILCQLKGGVATFDETLREMAKMYLEKKDPVVRAQRTLSKAIKKENTSESLREKSMAKKDSPQRPAGRKPLPQKLKNQVLIRDQGQCQERDFLDESTTSDTEISRDSNICGDSRWLDVHHIIPVSRGGKNTLENLVTLCRGHHALEHGSSV